MSGQSHGLDEARIVVAAREGDETARNQLTARFVAEVQAHLARRMGAKLARFATPEDLAQEALARALGGLHALADGAVFADFRGILLQHANWVLRDRGRQAQPYVAESIVHDGNGVLRSPAESAPSQGPVTCADEAQWLRERIADLDDKYSDVLVARLEQASFEEIAERLGISEEAARKRHTRALEMLRLRAEHEG